MRHLWLLPLLLVAGCYYPYGPYYPYYGDGGYPNQYYPYGYAPTYYAPGAPPPSYGSQPTSPDAQQHYDGNAQPGSGTPAASDPNNCGTPDEPKPCYRRPR